jgi:hypothetical protein
MNNDLNPQNNVQLNAGTGQQNQVGAGAGQQIQVGAGVGQQIQVSAGAGQQIQAGVMGGQQNQALYHNNLKELKIPKYIKGTDYDDYVIRLMHAASTRGRMKEALKGEFMTQMPNIVNGVRGALDAVQEQME